MVKFLKALLFFIIVLFAFSLGVKYSYLFTKADLNILTEADITFGEEDEALQPMEQKIVIEDIPVETVPLTEAEQNEIDTLNNTMPDFNGMNEEVGNELNDPVNPAPMNNGENYLDNMNNNSTNSVQQPTNNNVVQNVNTIPQEQATNNNTQQPTIVNQAQPQNANNNTQQPTTTNQVQQQNTNNNTQQPTTTNQAQPQNVNNNTQQPVANNQVQQQNINSNTQQQNVNTNNNVKAQ